MSYRSLPTILLTLAIAGLIFAFFTQPSFFEWAFERHQNTLSWIARPLLLLPFCLFAYLRSLPGIMASILAILTSMFWFPVPEIIDMRVAEFLAMERVRLTAGFDVANIISIIIIPAFLILLAMAFWQRSIWLGVGVAAAGAVAKSLWSVFASPDIGLAILPYAALGLVALIAAALVLTWLRHRASNTSD